MKKHCADGPDPIIPAAIGRIQSGGARHWPAVTVTGQPYTRPAHTVDLDGEAFVVLDAFPPPDTADRVAAARAWWLAQRPQGGGDEADA